MNSTHFYAVSALFNGLFGAFIVYYIYLRNKQNPINRSFMYLGISISGWSLIYSVWAIAENAKAAESYVRWQMMFECFIPSALFHFTTHLTNCFDKFKKGTILFYGLSVIFSLGMLTPFMITGVHPVTNFAYWPVPGKFLPLHVIHFIVAVLWSAGLMALSLRRAAGRERHQIFWILIGVIIGFGGGSMNWLPWFNAFIPPNATFFVGVMFAMIAYAIVKHGLMDTDFVLDLLRASRASAMGMMAGSLSHELRNPLYIAQGKIRNYLDQSERKIFTSHLEEIEKARTVFLESLNQLQRVADIIRRFSDLAKMSKSIEKKEMIKLKNIFEDVFIFISKELEESSIQIEDQIGEIEISVNRGQAEEVLLNLILNACQAIKGAAGGKITLKAYQLNSKAIIEIRDNGPGISKDQLANLFEPFLTTKTEGTGLGLYIVKQLVERNGGRICVKSQIGKGTAFILEFKQ